MGTYELSQLHFRFSQSADKEAIRELIGERFGNRDSSRVAESLDDRYLLAVEPTGKIIAMTGINESNTYNGAEVDWTCVSRDYQGLGLVTRMLAQLLEDAKQDVYCSCWRVGDNNHVNLQKTMDVLGFSKVVPEHKKFNSDFMNCRGICVNAKDGCHCCEDLFVWIVK